MKNLEIIIEKVKEAIKGREGFDMDSIFPFYLHATRIDMNQIELIDIYCKTNLEKVIRKNGEKLDVNMSLWTL